MSRLLWAFVSSQFSISCSLIKVEDGSDGDRRQSEETVESRGLGSEWRVILLVAHEDFPSVKRLNYSVIPFAFGVVHVAGPQVGESLELPLWDGLHIAEDGPLDALSAGWRRQWAIVAPEVGQIQSAQEALDADFLVCFMVTGVDRPDFVELSDKRIVDITTGFSIKEDTDNSSEWAIEVGVHEVEFEVVVLALDSVFGGCMHVELSELEFRFAAWVKGKLHLAAVGGHHDRVLCFVDFGLCLVEVGILSQLNGNVLRLLSAPVDEVDWGLLFAWVAELETAETAPVSSVLFVVEAFIG